jgi:FG-GAP-like repeat/PASTA domain/FG-GAP repeat
MLGVAALFAASPPSFSSARSYATGRFPNSVAIGDLNGDGRPDLVTANSVTPEDTVSVLLNRGDGSFQAKLDYSTGRVPESVAIGDLNGDGKPDLATANVQSDTVSVLRNRGDGGFQAKLDYATGISPYAVAIGDLNGDGKPDLATADFFPNTVSVLLNRGDGSFQAKVDYATGPSPVSVAIGDLNGDGKPDLAIANLDVNLGNSVSVLLNRGDGSFQGKVDYATGTGPSSVAIGDLNGDGKPELATANQVGGSVSVLANRGDGSFQAKLDYATGHRPFSVAIGDLNGDGKPELATANRDAGTASVLTNRGDGSFEATGGDGIFRAKGLYRTGGHPHSVAIGDLNGDRKPDLVTADVAPDQVSVLLNTSGLCAVQNVKRMTLPAAKRTLARANCRVGKIRRVYSKTVRKGRVISQKPKPGTVLPNGGKVNLVVSRGRKR